jgi:hypothetical protein
MGKISNETRAGRIDATLSYYKSDVMCERRESDEEDITDLLADLRHYCARRRLNFDAISRTSEMHFQAEKSGRGTR